MSECVGVEAREAGEGACEGAHKENASHKVTEVTTPRARRTGNYARGESHPRAKLTREDVEAIRTLHEEGRSMRSLAKQFELHLKTVQDILSYTLWA